MNLSSKEVTVLRALAIFGLIVPNGVFLYFAFSDTAVFLDALKNPISLVFIAEAFFLMALFAWLLKRVGVRKSSATVFVAMSLVGSMAFSVPMTLARIAKHTSSDEKNA